MGLFKFHDDKQIIITKVDKIYHIIHYIHISLYIILLISMFMETCESTIYKYIKYGAYGSLITLELYTFMKSRNRIVPESIVPQRVIKKLDSIQIFDKPERSDSWININEVSVDK